MDLTRYFPKGIRDDELFVRLRILLQLIHDKYDAELGWFIEKYSDPEKLPRDLLEQALITEMGYGYILDVLDMTDQELTTMNIYASVISLLKGTRDGFELVLKLLGLQYIITEWWEEPELALPAQTFKLNVTVENSDKMKSDTLLRLASFVKQYVYPFMYLDIDNAINLESQEMYIGVSVDRTEEVFGFDIPLFQRIYVLNTHSIISNLNITG